MASQPRRSRPEFHRSGNHKSCIGHIVPKWYLCFALVAGRKCGLALTWWWCFMHLSVMRFCFTVMERKLYVILCTLYFAFFIQRCESKKCMEGGPCPRECCMYSTNISPCCHPHRPIYEIDDRQVMAVGLTVICSCLVLTVTIVICCFWSRCPLYNTCRVNYTQGHVIAYPREDDPLNSIMPPDEGQNHYSPNTVKIRPVEDV